MAEALLPRVRSEIRACTRELGEIRRALEDPRADAAAWERRESDLHARARGAGWTLAMLGAAGGADLLRGRAAREGLRWMLATVAAARAASLRPAAEDVPLLAQRAGPELALLAAWCALRAPAGTELRWTADADGRALAFERAPLAAPAEEELALRCARLSALGAGTRVMLTERSIELRWP